MLPSPGRPTRRPRSRRKRPPFRRFPSSAGHFRHRRWMPSSLPFLLLALLLLFSPGNAQFGEIASVITSLLASGGGGAGLAGLSGLGAAGSGAGLAASAGSGAAGAAGSIGSLYQLAQAALQLTGTGVGIANQASESAWFPVVVENAAKMNKDFQERLLSGGALGPTGAGASGSKTSSSKSIGTEYGKEFGSGEETVVGIGENSLASRGGSGTDGGAGTSAIFPARGSSLGLGLPDLLPMPGRPMLPGLARLLPGESGPGTSVEAGAGGQTISTGKKLIGIGTVEEVPLSPPLAGTEPEAAAVLLPGEGGPSAGPDQQPQLPLLPDVSSELPPPAAPPPPAHFLPFPAISSPKITVKLPQSVDSEGEKELLQNKKEKEAATTIEQIETEFSTDTEQQRKAAAGEEQPSLNGTGQPEERERSEKERDEEMEAEGEDVDTAGLEPLIPSGPTAELQALNMTHIERFAAEHRGLTQMVPELRKLIGQLQMGNLTATELDELEAQLAGNAEAGEPRENTEPPPTSQSAAASAETRSSAESGRRPKGGRQRTPKVRNEKREQASHRNLEALRRGLHSSSDASEEEEEELVDGQQDPILRKIVDFNRPPVILSLERPSPGHRGTLLPGRRLSSHRVESSDDNDGGRDQEQKQQQQQRRGLSRAFGTQLEAVEEQQPTEEGGEEDGGEPATTTGGSDTTDSTTTKTTTRITRTSPTTTTATSTTILATTPIRAKIPVLATTQTKPSHHGGRLNGQQGTKPATTEKNATVAIAMRQKTSHQPQPALPVVDAAVEGTGSQQQRPQWPRPLPIVGQPTLTTTSKTPNQHGNQQQFQQQRGNNAQRQRPQHWQQQQGQQQHTPVQFGQQQQPRPQLQLQHQQPQFGQQQAQFGHYTQQQQWLGNNQPQWRWGQQQPQAQQQGWTGQQLQWGQQPQQHQPQQQWVQPQQPQHQEQKPSFQQSQFSPAHAQQPLPWRTVPDPAPVGPSPGLVYHPFSSGQLLTLNQPQQQQQADFFRFGGRK